MRRELVLSVVCSLMVGPAVAEVDRGAALEDMREIYRSIETLLPLSVDDAAFRSPAERERIQSALAELARRSQHMGSHVAGKDRRVRFLANSMARETREAKQLFDEQRYESAQFLVRQMTDFCVACHSRVPSPVSSALSKGFVDAGALSKLPAAQRASLQVATRQFDDAMTTFEALFASPDVKPAELLNPLIEYLRVSIRVKGDLERPRIALRNLAKREDLWANLREDVEDWIAALDRHAAQPRSEPSLESAHRLLAEAQRLLRYPSDRRGLVQQNLAASQLHRYLETRSGATGRDIAEAYYLLGLIETRTLFNPFVAEGAFYLETAVRLAPGDPVGVAAFEQLEEETVLGWTGSSGSHMPEDVRQNLEALREMVESASMNAGSEN